MTIDRITNHEALAIARLAEQYKNKPRLNGILNAQSVQVQEIEDILHAMFTNRSYADAAGEQLDRVGGIVGIARIPGETDADYRIRIAERIAENTGFGTPENIIELIAFLTDSDIVELKEIFPAAIIATIDGVILDEIAENVLETVQGLLPAGVKLAYLVQGADDDAFAFDGGGGLGFGDRYDDTIGGKFASIVGSDNSIDFGDEMPSKHVLVTFTNETTKDVAVDTYGLNAQKCACDVLDTATDYRTTEVTIDRPDIATIRLTSAVPITKTFRLILNQAAD